MRRFLSPLLITLLCLVAMPETGYPQGLIRQIHSPETTFQDERKDWIGERIQFLRQEKAERLGKYVGFCWEPKDARNSIVEYARLAGKQAVIEEVWLGSIYAPNDRDEIRNEIVAFWKMHIIGTEDIVWYWDDGLSFIDGAGFLKDYEAATKYVGDSLWAKTHSILYTLDDQDVVRLRNLQSVVLSGIRWGEQGNYPIKFILKTDKGEIGYLPGKDIDLFLDEWHKSNPRRKYKDWRWLYWLAIENRKLTTGMTPDMVRLAWGDPFAEDRIVAPQGIQLWLWIYRGVNKRIYGLFFINGKLVYWQWDERSDKDVDIIRFELRNARISKVCDVRFDWMKMNQGNKDFVTFSW
jgi:hypothetical protein